jgi:hypothetical protein
MGRVIQIMYKAVLASLLTTPFVAQAQTWPFRTGAPELSGVAKTTVPMVREQYSKFVDQLALKCSRSTRGETSVWATVRWLLNASANLLISKADRILKKLTIGQDGKRRLHENA